MILSILLTEVTLYLVNGNVYLLMCVFLLLKCVFEWKCVRGGYPTISRPLKIIGLVCKSADVCVFTCVCVCVCVFVCTYVGEL